MGVLHPQLRRPSVHHLHEGFLAARYVLRQADRRVVGALHRHRLQQIVHRHLLTGLQPDLAAAKARRHIAAGHGILQRDLAAFQRLHDQQQAHDLGDGSRGQLFIGVHLVQHPAGILIDQNSAFDRQRKLHLHLSGLRHLLLNHRRRDICVGDLLPRRVLRGRRYAQHHRGAQQPGRRPPPSIFHFHSSFSRKGSLAPVSILCSPRPKLDPRSPRRRGGPASSCRPAGRPCAALPPRPAFPLPPPRQNPRRSTPTGVVSLLYFGYPARWAVAKNSSVPSAEAWMPVTSFAMAK